MTDISAYELDTIASRAQPDQEQFTTRLLSALLIVGFPTCFWMSFLELTNYVFSIGISLSTRLIVAATLMGMLSMIWGFILMSARRRKN